ncbi:hypothetical protein [Dolichospermum heterosporum]|nr:hypothetical protein [Dolichospermum heterosporum]
MIPIREKLPFILIPFKVHNLLYLYRLLIHQYNDFDFIPDL